jgi:hypothetical protein
MRPPRACTISAIWLTCRSKQPQCAGIGDHEHGDLVVELSGQIVHVDESRGIALDRDEVEAGHLGAGRIGAVGAIGRQNLCPGLTEMPKVSRGNHQCRQFAMSPGRRLQRDGRQARDLAEHRLQLEEQLKKPLDRLLGAERMQIGDPRQRRHPFVPLAVVLHRATAERIEVRIDRHVERRKVREVANDFRLGHFRQRWRTAGPQARRPESAPRLRQQGHRTAATSPARRPGWESSNSSVVDLRGCA